MVVLVGPSASGKSTWADQWFPAGHIVSADHLRALVGEGAHDQRAGTDAFAVLDLVLERRLRHKLPTVIGARGRPAALPAVAAFACEIAFRVPQSVKNAPFPYTERLAEGLGQILQQVLDVLDAHGKAYQPGIDGQRRASQAGVAHHGRVGDEGLHPPE